MRSKRLRRFSEKYRDAVVKRILSGTSTMGQVRQELEMSEQELQDWFSDTFNRMQSKLDKLQKSLENVTEMRFIAESQEPNSLDDFIDDGPTIEGNFRPK